MTDRLDPLVKQAAIWMVGTNYPIDHIEVIRQASEAGRLKKLDGIDAIFSWAYLPGPMTAPPTPEEWKRTEGQLTLVDVIGRPGEDGIAIGKGLREEFAGKGRVHFWRDHAQRWGWFDA